MEHPWHFEQQVPGLIDHLGKQSKDWDPYILRCIITRTLRSLLCNYKKSYAETARIFALESHNAAIAQSVLDLTEENVRLRGVLRDIRDETLQFTHRDNNLQAWIHGIGKRARAALSAGERKGD